MFFFNKPTKLPGAGTKFNLRHDKAGQKSLRTTLGNLARHRQHYKSLSKDNIDTIVDVLDTSASKKAIRLKGGLSRYQVRKGKRELRKIFKADKHAFTKEDVKVGREIIDNYGKAGQSKQQEHNRPILHLSTPPEEIESSAPPHYGSISSLTRSKSIGSQPNMPASRPKPPSMRPTF